MVNGDPADTAPPMRRIDWELGLFVRSNVMEGKEFIDVVMLGLDPMKLPILLLPTPRKYGLGFMASRLEVEPDRSIQAAAEVVEAMAVAATFRG